jgi:hypothetical protein
MNQAADRLEAGDTSQLTQQIEEDARRRLAQMVEALRPEPPDESASTGDGAGQGGRSRQAQPGDLQKLAQLKLLRQMQVALHVRTLELDELSRSSGGRTAELERELLLLAREQGKLAELVFLMTDPDPPDLPPPEEVRPPEEDPELETLDDLLEQSLEDALEREETTELP